MPCPVISLFFLDGWGSHAGPAATAHGPRLCLPMLAADLVHETVPYDAPGPVTRIEGRCTPLFRL